MTAETQRRVAGRYLLLEPIGRGGMGVVWRAHDELLDRPVAVKEVLYHAMSEADRAAFNLRTIREARAAGRLDHPSVVVVHDVIEEDDRPWIVMQLVRARSLGAVIRADGPLPPGTVAEIGAQILDALRAAHAAGVLHRDVKPENVLISDTGRVVLTDFGIATMPEETALTTTGNLSGTPAFLPPERLRGSPAVPESDLWSLGATLYASVEGRPPFDKGAPVPTMAAVLNEQPEPMRLAGPLGPVIDGLLRKDPDRRMPAADVAEALRRVAALGRGGEQATRRNRLAGQPPREGRSRGRSSRPGRSPSARLALLAGLPVLLGVLGAAGWYGYHQFAGTRAAQSAPPVSSPAVSPPVTPASSAAVPTPAEPATGTPTPPAVLPSGWRSHTDPLGFTVGLPGGWVAFGREKARVRFHRPGSASYLMIDTTSWGVDDPLTALQGVEHESVSKGLLPGYRLLSFRPRTFLGRRAVDWEFTWQMTSAQAHVVDRGFTTADGRQLTLYWHTTADQWETQKAYFVGFSRSFRPS